MARNVPVKAPGCDHLWHSATYSSKSGFRCSRCNAFVSLEVQLSLSIMFPGRGVSLADLNTLRISASDELNYSSPF